MDVEKYRKLFLEECREHLQSINRELLRLEAEGEQFDGIDTLFREAHSIKGMSGSMGYDSMVALAHAMEDCLAGIREKGIQATGDIVSLLLEGADTLAQLNEEVDEKGSPSMDVTALVGQLRAVLPGGAAAPEAAPSFPKGGEISLEPEGEEASLPEVEIVEDGPAEEEFQPDPDERTRILMLAREGKATYRCRVVISSDTASLSARNFVVLGKLNKTGTIVLSKPSLPDVIEGEGSEKVEALVATTESAEELKAVLQTVPELEEIQVERLAVEAHPPTVPPGPEKDAGGERAGGGAAVRKPEREDASQSLIDRYLPRKSTSIRVDTRVLDDLIDIVGELIINRDGLLELTRDLKSEPLHNSLNRLDLLIRHFQDTIMSLRMMPMEVITDRLPRIVRDLAHHGGKDISFEIVGQGIELDRAILEQINDVLIHLVRNAIDHGVETAEERRKASKAPRAMIRLTAGRERDWVWITVEDDGCGMDAEKIKRMAVERGLIDRDRAEGMERQEILLLACLPGLSTAERVSNVSGRGVGMDVVKSKVESFGGSLKIDSQPGRGTKTTLHLPLTLAIVQTLLVEVRGLFYGLPVSHVKHTVRVSPSEVEWNRKKSVFRWGKEVVSLSDLGELIGLDGRDLSRGDPFPVVLTEHNDRLSALAVDHLLGSYEVVIKPLGLPLKKIPGLAGATILGDGRTVLILDVKALVWDRLRGT